MNIFAEALNQNMWEKPFSFVLKLNRKLFWRIVDTLL